MLSGKKLVNGFEDEPFLLGGVREKRQFGTDGKATDVIEGIRITAITQSMGNITIDLCPFTSEKLERCKKNFGAQFTVADLVKVEDCKIFVYKNELRVTIIAEDLCIESDPSKEVIEL